MRDEGVALTCMDDTHVRELTASERRLRRSMLTIEMIVCGTLQERGSVRAKKEQGRGRLVVESGRKAHLSTLDMILENPSCRMETAEGRAVSVWTERRAGQDEERERTLEVVTNGEAG